jgi:hypothetical protein
MKLPFRFQYTIVCLFLSFGVISAQQDYIVEFWEERIKDEYELFLNFLSDPQNPDSDKESLILDGYFTNELIDKDGFVIYNDLNTDGSLPKDFRSIPDYANELIYGCCPEAKFSMRLITYHRIDPPINNTNLLIYVERTLQGVGEDLFNTTLLNQKKSLIIGANAKFFKNGRIKKDLFKITFILDLLDRDGDGLDEYFLDTLCPFTEKGQTPLANGCTDNDGDGFYPDVDRSKTPDLFDENDMDSCWPSEQSGTCDSDGDGLVNLVDDCPDSAPGAVVNEKGCTDEDRDGSFADDANIEKVDPDDQNPCSPSVNNDYCDEDDDGIPNFRDNCPKSEANAEVNENGCTDFDGDGYFPDTESPKKFDPDDTDSCRPSPQEKYCDQDGDGVINKNDKCPFTEKGAKVDTITGCTDNDNDGYFPDAIPSDASKFDPDDNDRRNPKKGFRLPPIWFTTLPIFPDNNKMVVLGLEANYSLPFGEFSEITHFTSQPNLEGKSLGFATGGLDASLFIQFNLNRIIHFKINAGILRQEIDQPNLLESFQDWATQSDLDVVEINSKKSYSYTHFSGSIGVRLFRINNLSVVTSGEFGFASPPDLNILQASIQEPNGSTTSLSLKHLKGNDNYTYGVSLSLVFNDRFTLNFSYMEANIELNTVTRIDEPISLKNIPYKTFSVGTSIGLGILGEVNKGGLNEAASY